MSRPIVNLERRRDQEMDQISSIRVELVYSDHISRNH